MPDGPLGEAKLYLRPTGRYWFPILFGAPPVLDAEGDVLREIDSGVRQIRLRTNESRLLAGAALAGKVGFAWWSATGDDFHCNSDEADLGRRLAHSVDETAELVARAEAVLDAGRKTAFVSKNNDGYVNVRWNAARDATDAFDRAILEAAGLSEHWRPLNVWYRQCMRSTRENTNSRYLTDTEIANHLKW